MSNNALRWVECLIIFLIPSISSAPSISRNSLNLSKNTKKDKKQGEQVQTIKIEKAVINKEIIPLKELSEKIGISAIEKM